MNPSALIPTFAIPGMMRETTPSADATITLRPWDIPRVPIDDLFPPGISVAGMSWEYGGVGVTPVSGGSEAVSETGAGPETRRYVLLPETNPIPEGTRKLLYRRVTGESRSVHVRVASRDPA